MKKIYFVLFVLLTSPSFPCTSFFLHNNQKAWVGKTYDWLMDSGLVIGNKKNVQKTAIFPKGDEKNPAKWISKYSSVTFNQYGQEFPNGGINEAGLVVETLWLEASVFPAQDSRPALNELQWVQYQLDNFATTSELIKAANQIRIHNIYAPTHYFVCDANRDCAVLEYLAGNLVVSSALPHALITNDTYSSSVAALSKYQSFGGTEAIPQGSESLSRFVRAAFEMKCANPSRTCAEQVLASVTTPDGMEPTMWRILYDQTAREVAFDTYTNRETRNFSLGFNTGNCKSSVLAIELTDKLEGEITHRFSPLTYERNLTQVKLAFQELGILGESLVHQVASYPATTQCLE